MSSDDPEGCSQTFENVLERLLAGDERGIEMVFTELQPRLLRFFRAQESRVADDLAAQVWLGVAKTVGQFSGDWDDFRAWVFSIARRRLADHRRTAVRHNTEPVDGAAFDLHESADATETQALAALTAQEAVDTITARLRGDEAEVLLLRVLGDVEVDQVASIMQRTPNWVRVTQHRALRKLAKRLGSRNAVMQ